MLPDVNKNIARNVQFDVYFPKMNLAFEYQGVQHYQKQRSFLIDTHSLNERDEAKKLLCKELNITLISIPYWWDYQVNSLKATIHQYRPDLIAAQEITSNPIPDLPSSSSKHRLTRGKIYSSLN